MYTRGKARLEPIARPNFTIGTRPPLSDPAPTAAAGSSSSRAMDSGEVSTPRQSLNASSSISLSSRYQPYPTPSTSTPKRPVVVLSTRAGKQKASQLKTATNGVGKLPAVPVGAVGPYHGIITHPPSVPNIHALLLENEQLKAQLRSITCPANQPHSRDSAFEQERLRHEETKKLLEARTAELDCLKGFLGPMSNSVTEVEAKTMVEALNAEILQVSATIADSLDPQHRHYILPEYEKISARLTAQNLLDKYILEKLWNAYEDVGFRVQLALQACMASLCTDAINYLSYRNLSTLETLKTSVSQSVAFPVYARWRAITAQQTVQPAEWTKFWLSLFSSRAKYVLYIAGFVKQPPQIQERLGRVIEMATALNIALKQHMLSTDAEVFCCEPGEWFNPTTMQVDYSPRMEQPSLQERILCTTGIGLRFRDGKTGQSAIALKAVVGLRDIFEDDSDLV